MIYNEKLNFSKLGMGFMRHDENNFGKTQELVDYAIAHGVNYFEACSFYLNRKCESIIGKALSKYPRDSFYICDKYDVLGYNLPINELEGFFNEQLRTCGVDYFDVYLLQALDRRKVNEIDEVYKFFMRKKQEGKIKYFGFSFHDTADILEGYLQKYKWDCCQIQLNYYDWYLGEGKRLYQTLVKYDLPILVMGPYKGGTLTSRQPQYIQQYYSNEYLAHLAMHFLQTLPQVKVILTGAEHLGMLQENINLIDNYSFTQQDKESCNQILEIYKQNNVVNCGGCRYCEPGCPRNIKIADCFKWYNKLLLDPNDKEAREQFTLLSKADNSFFECIGCGQCERRCPQHLNIIQAFHNQLFTARL